MESRTAKRFRGNKGLALQEYAHGVLSYSEMITKIFFPIVFAFFACGLLAADIELRDMKTGDLHTVPEDILKVILAIHHQIEDLGGYDNFRAGETPFQLDGHFVENGLSEIVDVLTKAKEATLKNNPDDIVDISTEKEWKLIKLLEQKMPTSSDQLLTLIAGASFLDVNSLLQVAVRSFVHSYASTKSNFHNLNSDVKALIISSMSPVDFKGLVKANKETAKDSAEEEHSFKIACRIHFNCVDDKSGITAKKQYIHNLWRTFVPLPQPRSWSTFLPSENITSLAIHDGVMCIGTDRGLAISHDDGKTFDTISMLRGLGSNHIKDVKIHEDENGHITIYAATSSGLAISTDGGNTFSIRNKKNGLTHSDDINKIRIHQDRFGYLTIYLATGNGLYFSTDGGNSFAAVASIGGIILDVTVDDREGKRTIVAASDHSFFISTDGGKSFEKSISGCQVSIHREGKVFVTLFSSQRYNTWVIATDHGNRYSKHSLWKQGIKNAVVLEDADGHAIYGSTGQSVVVSHDYGNSFRPVADLAGEITSIATRKLPDNQIEVYAATKFGLYVARNGSNQFEKMAQGLSEGLNVAQRFTVHQSGDGLIQIYMLEQGELSISTDGANTFTRIESDLESSINDLAVRDNEDGTSTLYAATYDGLAASTNRGANFHFLFYKQRCHFKRVVVPESKAHPNNVYALIGCKFDFALAISEDGGKTFSTGDVPRLARELAVHEHSDGKNRILLIKKKGELSDNLGDAFHTVDGKEFHCHSPAIGENEDGILTFYLANHEGLPVTPGIKREKYVTDSSEDMRLLKHGRRGIFFISGKSRHIRRREFRVNLQGLIYLHKAQPTFIDDNDHY